MSVKVSVVVPVYNPGRYIEPCIESLLRQTLPPGEHEVVFVDDGSTDETPARLDELAASHSHVRVIHQENSGWPGKPRNVGVDASRGEYVQFVDQDDALGLEALERLYAMAARNGSDIVLGKVAGTMGGPHGIFRRTVERCTVADQPLIESLTPHKMFRRAFLAQHALRYPEGKRRLEDQLFMVNSYLAAETVSILADYPCYYWIRRDDGKNTSMQRGRAKDYFDNLREVIGAIVAGTESGELRDRLLRRPLRVEMLGRLSEPGLLKYSDAYRTEIYAEIRRLALECFSDAVIDGLPPVTRVRAKLLIEDRLDGLMELARRCQAVRMSSRLQELRWHGGRLHLAFRLRFRHGNGRPLVVLERDGRYLLDPVLTQGIPGAEGLEFGSALDDADVNVTLRHRQSPVSWHAPVSWHVPPAPAAGRRDDRSRDGWLARGVVLAGATEIDPLSAAGGRPLEEGVWDIHVGGRGTGLGRSVRVGADRHQRADAGRLPAVLGAPALVATPYWSRPRGELSLDIGEQAKSLVREMAGLPVPRAGPHANALELPLPAASAPGAAPLDVAVLIGEDESARPLRGRLVSRGERIVLRVDWEAKRGPLRLTRARRQGLYIQTEARRREVPARVGTVRLRGGDVVGVERLTGRQDANATSARRWVAALISHPRPRAAARRLVASLPRRPARLARAWASGVREWAER